MNVLYVLFCHRRQRTAPTRFFIGSAQRARMLTLSTVSSGACAYPKMPVYMVTLPDERVFASFGTFFNVLVYLRILSFCIKIYYNTYCVFRLDSFSCSLCVVPINSL